MRDEFRPAGVLTEFYGELDSLRKSEGNVLVWQTPPGGKRRAVTCIIKSYLVKKNETIINLLSLSSEELKFSKKSAVFIYEEKKGILFKGRFETSVQKSLKLIADDRVFLREKRNCPRVNFFYTKVLVDITYEKKLNFHKVLLKDISETGFSLFIQKNMATAFKEGFEVNITSLNAIEMPVKLEGQIVYKSPAEKALGGEKGMILVGIKFNARSKLIKKIMKGLKKK